MKKLAFFIVLVIWMCIRSLVASAETKIANTEGRARIGRAIVSICNEAKDSSNKVNSRYSAAKIFVQANPDKFDPADKTDLTGFQAAILDYVNAGAAVDVYGKDKWGPLFE